MQKIEKTVVINRNRRLNRRKSYQGDVAYSLGSMIFPGVIKNISIGGARIGSRNKFNLYAGGEIIVSIPFAKRQGCLKRKAIVMWTEKDQFGIKFNRRINERKNYQKDVSFFTDAKINSATIRNLSLGGAHIENTNLAEIKKGSEIYVIIPFAIKQDYMTRKAVVMWADKSQFGIKFI
jgi:hypothetical protein